VVPVGTGWLDPGGHDTYEYMLSGDVATVAVQYSYLTSGLSLLAHPEFGIEQARSLFKVIYAHWSKLPRESRPKFYVHGLSQGAFNSQETLPLLDIFADPIDGALWTGSPFFAPIWQQVRTGRQPDSPAWLPRYGNGSLVRVSLQNGKGLQEGAAWGPIRLVLLNYGSDPMVAFTFSDVLSYPDWLRQPRPHDVSPRLRWFPFVTMLQIAIDMSVSLDVPGYGHYYIARDYIDAWAEVMAPPDWSEERASQLKAVFAKRGSSF
ncbi:MAG: alpha/beta-hydrolase family protein, partial [Hyphomicrobiaceae bacterium]